MRFAMHLFVSALELRLEGAKELDAGKMLRGNEMYERAGEKLAGITAVLQARG
jgi:hypothetical protein